MLQVQDVSVEVGGKFVVEHASFTVMPRGAPPTLVEVRVSIR